VLPLAGKLSDELGRKRVFLAAVVIFTVASFLCGFAPNIYVLVVCRLLQALGCGAFLPSCTGSVADLFPDRRAQAIEPRPQNGVGQFSRRASDQAAAHGLSLAYHAATSNNSRGVLQSTSTPRSVTTTASPNTI